MPSVKPAIRFAAWTAWAGATIMSKGLLAPLGAAIDPAVGKLGDKLDQVIGGIIGNWLSDDLRAEDIDPGKLDGNGHLEKLTALAVHGVVTCLPKYNTRFTSHAKLCRQVGQALARYWPTLHQLKELPDPQALDAAPHSERVSQLILDYLQDPRSATALTVELWELILKAGYEVPQGALPQELRLAIAEALHQHLGRFLYEAAKVAQEKFPAAAKAIQLHIQTQQTALLHSLNTHAHEMAEWFTGRFTDVNTELAAIRAAVEAQSDAFALLTSVKEDTSTILRFLREQLPVLMQSFAAGHKITPPRHRPQAAGRLFGREADVPAVLALLREHRQIAIVAEGGLGKTALSAEVIAQLEAATDGPARTQGGLYLHDFYRQPSLAAFVGNVLQQAGIVCQEVQHQPALAALALRQPGTFLYIEGAEKVGDLADLLAFLDAETQLLLTTRPRTDLAGLEAYALEPMAEAAAAQAIHFYATKAKRPAKAGPYAVPAADPGWAVLARDLGGHALACRIAGDLCGLHSRAPLELHADLLRLGLQPLIAGLSADKRPSSKHNVIVLFRQSALSVIAAEGPLPEGQPSPAIAAWRMLTLGGSNPSPLSVLEALGLHSAADLQPLLDLQLVWSKRVPSVQHNHPDAPESARTEPAYALAHALLADWAREGLEEFGSSRVAFQQVAMSWGKRLLNEVVPACAIPGGPDRYRVINPVIEGLLAEIKRCLGIKADMLGMLFYLSAHAHELHANYFAAEMVFREALSTMTKMTGVKSLETAAAKTNLGWLLHLTSQVNEAESLMRQALPILEQTLGPEHRHVATTLSNLAQLLQSTNRFAEAKLLMQRALAISEQIHGPEHPSVSRELNNLAWLLQETNNLAEAEPLLQRALKISERNFGSEHPNVAVNLNNLALLLRDTNRMDESEVLMRRSLAISVMSYGSEHPTVATTLTNLATLLKITQRQTEAEQLLQQALAIDEQSFGPEHPEVAIDLGNLAALLKAMNRLAEAEPLMRRHLDIFLRFTRSTGYPHPHLESAKRNYFSLLRDCGRTEAEAQAELQAMMAQA